MLTSVCKEIHGGAMSIVEKKAIQITAQEVAKSSGVFVVRLYSRGDCYRRAAISLLACMGLAGVTLFIPLAHFILVPCFLILGPILAVKQYRARCVTEKAEGICPLCKQQVVFPLEADDSLPKPTYCPKCHGPVSLIEK